MKFLSDKTPNIDLLGGYHNQLAESLERIIIGSDQPLSIALCGEKGSGKSTIIEILKGNLKNKKYAFLTYDAWFHQHDPTRRSFLLSMYKDAKDLLENSENFLSQSANLENGKKFSKCVTKNWSPIALIALIYALIVLFFAKNVGEKINDTLFTIEAPNYLDLQFLFALTIVFLPLFIFCIPYLREKCFSHFEPVLRIKPANTSESKKTDMEHHDFIGYFNCLCAQLKAHGMSPIIIIDDLDRVSNKKDIEELLSQIKSIFDACLNKNNKFSPIFIACITASKIKGYEDRVVNTLNNQNYIMTAPDIDAEKYFDVVLTSINISAIEVKLRKYFEELISKSELSTLAHMSDIFYSAFSYSNSSSTKTPRGAKKFINNLIVEIFLLQKLIEENAHSLNIKEIYQVIALYVSIRNFNDKQLILISSMPDRFNEKYIEVYGSSNPISTQIKSLPIRLSRFYNQIEGRNKDVTQITIRNIRFAFEDDIQNIPERGDSKHDAIFNSNPELTLSVFNEESSKEKLLFATNGDLYKFYKTSQFIEKIIAKNTQPQENHSDTIRLRAFVNSDLKRSIYSFNVSHNMHLKEISSFLLENFRKDITVDSVNWPIPKHSTTIENPPPTLYNLFIISIIIRLLSVTEIDTHGHIHSDLKDIFEIIYQNSQEVENFQLLFFSLLQRLLIAPKDSLGQKLQKNSSSDNDIRQDARKRLNRFSTWYESKPSKNSSFLNDLGEIIHSLN